MSHPHGPANKFADMTKRQADNKNRIHNESHADDFDFTLNGFRQHIIEQNPILGAPLVYRIASALHQQYRLLRDVRATHNCMSRTQCVKEVASTWKWDAQGFPLLPEGSQGRTFECPFCLSFLTIDTKTKWSKHVYADFSAYTCTWEECKRSDAFKFRGDWTRHQKECHLKRESWKCHMGDCSSVFYRVNNLYKHLKVMHELEKEAVDPKLFHNVEKAATKSDRCRFCGQQLETWHGSIAHHAEHMENISKHFLRLITCSTRSAKPGKKRRTTGSLEEDSPGWTVECKLPAAIFNSKQIQDARLNLEVITAALQAGSEDSHEDSLFGLMRQIFCVGAEFATFEREEAVDTIVALLDCFSEDARERCAKMFQELLGGAKKNVPTFFKAAVIIRHRPRPFYLPIPKGPLSLLLLLPTPNASGRLDPLARSLADIHPNLSILNYPSGRSIEYPSGSWIEYIKKTPMLITISVISEDATPDQSSQVETAQQVHSALEAYHVVIACGRSNSLVPLPKSFPTVIRSVGFSRERLESAARLVKVVAGIASE